MSAIRVTVNQNQQQYPTFQIQVNDNQPIYIYSSADNDCQNGTSSTFAFSCGVLMIVASLAGMVFAVNINQQRFQEFQQRARQQPRQNQNQNNQNQNQNNQNQNNQNQNNQNQNNQNQNRNQNQNQNQN